MKLLKILSLTLLFLSSTSFIYHVKTKEKVRILLIGDSTTIGGKGVFETTIEEIINKDLETPSVEVINSAKGGETAFSVVESGRYDNDIKPLDNIDYIFVRYGINDSFKRKPVEENFPEDYKKLISKLRSDFPSAKIILTTIIPFFKNEDDSIIINNMVKQLAEEEKLELFDVYPVYKQALEIHGENSMNVRFFPLSDIPEVYKEVALPYSSYVEWKETDMVRVLTTELDPVFGNLEGWYNDGHPNPMGYRLLALETVKYLLPKLKSNPNSLPLSKKEAESFRDKIYEFTAPKEFKAGEKIKVNVKYAASQKRDLAVFIQLNKDPWITVSATLKGVDLGSGTEEFNILIPKDIKSGSDYKIVVNILPKGKGWPDRLDERSQANVSISN
ncbi:Lysophospholipase L1 [Lutibacter agarilyticus]|uniref:Lysophospholipase L1 n=1 Tax=Lutibacter agarilyticus TaxID=1109740 RepID=A0A238X5N4_9FLAO|nr:GDSL-type esterase/lipase family protein [Lutibacter agarilyticus]SNR54365.1 Lysophospholipase L1 [Lutibacter agarilyticus]